MTTITITTQGLDELIRNLGLETVKPVFKDAANRAVAEVAMRAQGEVPRRSHQLAQSHIVLPASLNTLKAEVYTEKEYAVPVHEGHRIVAWGRDTGRFKEANPWMERAVDKSESMINSIFNKAADQVVSSMIQ